MVNFQLGQQRFGVPEIRDIEAFGELTVNRLYQLQGFRNATVSVPKSSYFRSQAVRNSHERAC
jgi:hypothetical protein